MDLQKFITAIFFIFIVSMGFLFLGLTGISTKRATTMTTSVFLSAYETRSTLLGISHLDFGNKYESIGYMAAKAMEGEGDYETTLHETLKGVIPKALNLEGGEDKFGVMLVAGEKTMAIGDVSGNKFDTLYFYSDDYGKIEMVVYLNE